MDSNKRLIIAIVLSLVIMLLYPYFLRMLYPPPPAEKTVMDRPLEKEEEPAVVERPEEEISEEVPTAPEAVKEELIAVETPLVKAVFTSLGGAVVSWELKNYRESLEETSKGIDIVKGKKTAANINPLQTRVISAGLPEIIPFEPSKNRILLSEDEHAELVFTWMSPGGVMVEKRFTFTGNSYSVGTELKVINGSQQKVKGEVQTRLVSSYKEEPSRYYHSGPVRHIKDEVTRQKPDDALESGRGFINWLGLEDKYFLLALIPGKDVQVKWETEVPAVDTARAALSVPLELNPGESLVFNHMAFMGPKQYDMLRSYGVGLEEAIEFGFFSFLAKPFLVVLNFFERYLKNYGLAIILLTCIIKVVFHPLTKHSLKSMREMQKIQPQLNALKQKYKDDKEKMNKEVMGLYKRYKINPLGGCLPMVMQIPVFIALYEVLSVAIELRHAPFALWIMDLSAKDPYYVTPVLMGASMLVQQKMTPSVMDPAQAKIMLIMPVVFTFIFLSFPSGLVLYWLVNNVLSIAQQYHIYRGKK
jgi:YidC/Oxa1 family membrane protein insertase